MLTFITLICAYLVCVFSLWLVADTLQTRKSAYSLASSRGFILDCTPKILHALQSRMKALYKPIRQTNKDVLKVYIPARKISEQINRIEQVELGNKPLQKAREKL